MQNKVLPYLVELRLMYTQQLSFQLQRYFKAIPGLYFRVYTLHVLSNFQLKNVPLAN